MERFPEIDFFRGLAVIGMIASNLFTDLDYFRIYNFDSFPFLLFARIVAFAFVFIAGVSFCISNFQKKKTFFANFKRGIWVFSLGMLITIASFVFLRSDFVVFGALHLIGFSVILGYFFLPLKNWNFSLGILIMIAGLFSYFLTSSSYFLVWLGFAPANFSSVDYFPVLPWLGVFLFGLAFGNWFYVEKNRKPEARQMRSGIVEALGKNSLLVYFLHQPIILGILWALKLINF